MYNYNEVAKLMKYNGDILRMIDDELSEIKSKCKYEDKDCIDNKKFIEYIFYFETHRKVQNILRQVASKLTKKMEIRNSMTPEELETDKKQFPWWYNN